jgi:preprotein translocase subunit SecD
MKKNIRVRTVIILLVTLVSLYAIFMPHGRRPVLADLTDPNAIGQNLRDNIHLGLDLRGGIHLVMQVQAEEAVDMQVKTTAESAAKALEAKGIQLVGEPAIDAENNSYTVRVADAGRAQEAADALAEDAQRNALQGRSGWTASTSGDAVTVAMARQEAGDIRRTAHDQAKNIIDKRIDQFGVAEHVLQNHGAEGDYQILLQLPGVDDPERVKKLLQAESNLELKHLVGGPALSPEQAQQASPGFDPGKHEVVPYVERMDGDTDDTAGAQQPTVETPPMFAVVEKEPIIRGVDLRTAQAMADMTGRNYEIQFSLKQGGAEKFGAWTGANVGERLAIVLNGKVMSAPTIQSQITDTGQITGKFSQRSAEDLALTLRSGSLPARVVYQEERTVGPSLGAESIRQGLISSTIGLSVVCLFLLFYYRFSGVNAIVALVLNLLILLAGLAMMKAALTLPGIAGVILLIGMAVDSNVLIFERIREELRNGKVVRSAVDTGFGKAFTTIMDTHVTTIVSAVFLMVFGTGPIRGFAVTLIIGLLANLFTAVFVSRTLFTWVIHRSGRPAETLSI